MNKGGFSWKRFTGATRLKSRIAKTTGIPTTRHGRQRKVTRLVTGKGRMRKIARMKTGGGCAVVIASGLALSLLVGAVVGVAMATR